MTREKNRTMTPYEFDYLEHEGMRLGDLVKITPPDGRGIVLALNRTAIYLQLVAGFENKYRGTSWSFPKYDYPCSNYKFELIAPSVVKKEQTKDGASRFLLRAMGRIPFILNGSPTFEAFLRQGDQLQMGRHLIYIQRKAEGKAVHSPFEMNKQLVESKLNILLTGETGTGKTHLAQEIHLKSGRSGEFVHVNLQSFSLSLLESELFGHVKGAFSGATHDKRGAFRQAHRGTLFIDEIDSLPIEIQTKLLLFLEDKKVRPVGSERTYECDVRIICASGQCLPSLVESGGMRSDFYYRISSGAKFHLPPLRESPELLKSLCQGFGDRHQRWISTSLLDFYLRKQWSGNIRELMGHLEKKLVYSRGSSMHLCPLDEELGDKSLIQEFVQKQKRIDSLEDFKNLYCQKVLLSMGGNIRMTARALKVAPNTIRKAARLLAA